MNLDANEKIEAAKGVIASIYASQRALRALAPDYKWAGLGNLLGDFGEFIAINHYGLEKAQPGSDGYDALTKDGKTIQIKTNHAAQQIGYRGKADLMLVIHVEENGNWNEIYFGDYDLVEKNSTFSARDNKRMIPILKLKRLQEEKNQTTLEN